MKDFDNSLVALLQAENATTFWCVDFLVSTTEHVYYTNLDIDLVIDGHTYQSKDFTVPEIDHTLDLSVDKITLSFANQGLEMSALLLNYTLANRESILYLGALDGYTPITEEFFRGPVSAWELDESGGDTAQITITTEMVYWNKRALRLPGPLCPWTFGGLECGYSGGETTCNQTYDRCLVLSNTDNFGGARFLPSIEEKQIWWGKKSI